MIRLVHVDCYSLQSNVTSPHLAYTVTQCPPRPTPIEPWDIPILIPDHLNTPPPPPHLGKSIYPLSRVLVTIGNYKKYPLFRTFSGNLPETLPPPPFSRENGNAHGGPLMHSSGGGGGGDPMSAFLLSFPNLSFYSLFFIFQNVL